MKRKAVAAAATSSSSGRARRRAPFNPPPTLAVVARWAFDSEQQRANDDDDEEASDDDADQSRGRRRRRTTNTKAPAPPPSPSPPPPTLPLPPGARISASFASPPLLVIDDFLSAAECARLLALADAHAASFRASPQDDDGATAPLHTSQRTSRSLFLPRAEPAAVRRVEQRAATLLGLADARAHLEHLQVVTYTDGARFERHHDSGTWNEESDVIVPARPLRVFTLLIYLNTVAARDGGATVFPRVNRRVQPLAGRAVLWPNVLKNGTCDVRTVHQAEPVKGSARKWAINCWITEKRLG